MARNMDTDSTQLHDCTEVARKDIKLRPDLRTEPLQNPQLTLFTDGCCYKGDNGNVASFAVVEQDDKGTHHTRDQGVISQPAQLAEIIALTRALQLAEGKAVNIYTDSAYGHGAVHVDGPQWLRRNFLTTVNTPVKHRAHLEDLIQAVSLPSAVAAMKCKGHQKLETQVAEGNHAADQAAKQAGGYTPRQMVLTDVDPIPELQIEDIIEMQSAGGIYEQNEWLKKGATKSKEGLWRAHDGRLVDPSQANKHTAPHTKEKREQRRRDLVAPPHDEHSEQLCQ